jgi:2,3-bisphosphoglycerate-independent phosphoglycerate mutase
VHVEAPDEAGHIGKTDLKIRAIEDLDRRLLGRLLGRIGDGFRILLMPDHPTPIRIKTHSGEPVPFALWGSGIPPNGAGGRAERGFSEREAEATGLFVEKGHEIINLLFRRRYIA